MTFYLGKVPCDLHKCATRVRVQIEGVEGVPLSVKACLGDHSRNLFTKGRAVEVEQSPLDGRVFRVTQVFAVVKKPIVMTCDFNYRVPTPAAFGFNKERSQTVKENISFYLNSRYFDHPELKHVLNRTFNIGRDEFSGIKRGTTGIRIICTTDQFARFLIDRNLNGIKNGFMDLGAKLVRPEPEPDAYEMLAKIAGITRKQARGVALALGYSNPTETMQRVRTEYQTPRDCAREIDVSNR